MVLQSVFLAVIDLSVVVKEGREETKVADSIGGIHKSIRERLDGNAGQLNRCSVVWSSTSHSGQRGEFDKPMRNKQESSLLQYPERSWARMARYCLGRRVSEAWTGGRGPSRILLLAQEER